MKKPQNMTAGHNTHSEYDRRQSELKKNKSRISSWWTSLWVRGTWWDSIFVASCVIAVSLDPLFFYIPIIDREKKCLQADRQLRTVTLILRSVMDITFIVHIIYQIREAMIAAALDKMAKPKSSDFFKGPFFKRVGAIVDNLSWRSLITDILAVLPIPQVLLLVVFFKMRGSGYLNHRKILNFFLLLQYLARIYRIHLSSKKLTKSHGIWIKGLFNLFLYIFASHVLGAFWYFFSIQRETSCWHRSCGPNCISTFYCDEYKHSDDMVTLITSLNASCPINTTGPFDFGIFLDSLKSNNPASINFPQKLCYSFWWGLRNLSNFGTNLVTSNYVWENLFAILISIIGLLLFLYLIGNVQTFMSMGTAKSEEIRRKIKSKKQVMKEWMEKNCLPAKLRKEIMANIREKLEQDNHADMGDPYSILPSSTKKSLKRALCMSTLRKVPRLEGMNPKVLKMICDYLKPVTYPEHHYVAKVDEPVDQMVLVKEGTMWIYSSNTSTPSKIHRTVENGGIYGDEQLLSWASKDMQHVSFENFPISKENVKCHTKVEGFAIAAKDLKDVATKCKMFWNYDDPREERVASSTIGRTFRRNRNNPNRPATVGVGAATSSRTGIEYLQIERT
ncbi:cyclic nucleotide-gated ion channel 1 isoform X2 [Rosa chinensis]|uniref:cyclic nucleotide-gated ion channel 1 isoform X2 n=1 Tax=Rosa chinensis TaxID=74649 RepID=UPI001AD8F3E0|nr:cyclic nucleotide-gated ion channel 1 isoform X2 [Rosa chinensis]